MRTTKTFMLAAGTALSLGAGSAMAQEAGPSVPTIRYWAASANPVDEAAVMQSGSSDESLLRQANFKYGNLANPG